MLGSWPVCASDSVKSPNPPVMLLPTPVKNSAPWVSGPKMVRSSNLSAKFSVFASRLFIPISTWSAIWSAIWVLFPTVFAARETSLNPGIAASVAVVMPRLISSFCFLCKKSAATFLTAFATSAVPPPATITSFICFTSVGVVSIFASFSTALVTMFTSSSMFRGSSSLGSGCGNPIGSWPPPLTSGSPTDKNWLGIISEPSSNGTTPEKGTDIFSPLPIPIGTLTLNKSLPFAIMLPSEMLF